MDLPPREGIPRFCLIVPCYNEEQVLPILFQKVIPAIDNATDGSWSLLCIDDGSQDATFEIIGQQHCRDRRVLGIRLSRNFGHQPAVSVGLAFARAEYIGIIDADLQDPVEVLVKLYNKASREGLDVCYGIRGRRDSPLFLRLAYSIFYRAVNKLGDHAWPRDAGDFCVLSARCHQVLISLPEHSRMVRGLRAWVGFKQAGVTYDRPARLYGKTKYSLRRLCALAMQGFVAFSSIPLRIATILGIAMTAFSALFGMFVLLNRLVPKFTVVGYWVGANPGLATILLFLSFMGSMMFLCLGIIGEYLIVMFQELKRRPTAIIDTVVGDVRKTESASHVNCLGAKAVSDLLVEGGRLHKSR